jgi:hypothetical protein
MFQDLKKQSRTTTIAVGCHHGYTGIAPMFQVVAIRDKHRDSVTGALTASPIGSCTSFGRARFLENFI